MLALAVVFELSTECIDFTLAFLEAPLDVDICMKIPQGLKMSTANNGEYVLKLIKSLYGLKDTSKRLFDLLSASLRKRKEILNSPSWTHVNSFVMIILSLCMYMIDE